MARQYAGKVILGLDARGGVVATEGWDKDAGITALEFVQHLLSYRWRGLFYTDIDRDGMMQGLNVDATLALAEGRPEAAGDRVWRCHRACRPVGVENGICRLA